jgi:acetyl-CoA synthetase
MGESIYPVPEEWAQSALIDNEGYPAKYRQSIENPEAFWAEEARRIDWIRPFTKAKETSFTRTISASGGLPTARSTSPPTRWIAIWPPRDQIAILWARQPRGSRPPHHLSRTARAGLPLRQCAKGHGVKRGDRVTIYLPMVPEAAVAMLACARIGAIHSIVFAGFSPRRWRAA